MAGGERLVEAAGGVLWRPADHRTRVEVAIIHRPKYDDWSLPKGKLLSGEHVLLGAIREVAEETGYVVTVGRPLGEIRYDKDGQPKRVRYWAMRAVAGEFTVNDEVDELRWLPPNDAQRLLSPDRDRGILDEFLRDMSATWPCVVIRHGSAGERSAWEGDDHDRPLDEVGHRQAAAFVAVLSAYGVRRVLSSDVLRCLDTVEPYAAAAGCSVEAEPLMSETGYLSHPDAALERFLDVASAGVPTAVCSQGKAIPDLLARALTALGHDVPDDTSVRKGGWGVLHMAANGSPRLLAFERFDPVPLSA
jgi:8-oxo-dGTP pyrophosphatase MutT (NUDIX family)/phosphohistidine phosphatase SixA